MALRYRSAGDGPIRQTELLKDVVELQAVGPRLSGQEGRVSIRRVEHPLVIVLSQDCDLEQDFNLRFPKEAEPTSRDEADITPGCLSHVILCDAWSEEEYRRRLPKGINSYDRRKIGSNQNERYHRLESATIGEDGEEIDELFIDFRRFFALPSADLYDQVDGKDESRVACLPAYHLHDLAQRFFSYQARVAVP